MSPLVLAFFIAGPEGTQTAHLPPSLGSASPKEGATPYLPRPLPATSPPPKAVSPALPGALGGRQRLGALFHNHDSNEVLKLIGEKIAAPPARGPAGARRAPGRLQRAPRGGQALSSFPGARAPGYFSLALCKQDNLLRPRGAQITIVSHTNIRHARPPESREGPLSRRWGPHGVRRVRPGAPFFPGSCGPLRAPPPAAGRGTLPPPRDRSYLGGSARQPCPSQGFCLNSGLLQGTEDENHPSIQLP